MRFRTAGTVMALAFALAMLLPVLPAAGVDVSCDPQTEVCPVEPVNVLPAGNSPGMIAPDQTLRFEGPVQEGWTLEFARFVYYDGSGAFLKELSAAATISGGELSGEGRVSLDPEKKREYVRVRVGVKRDLERYVAETSLVEIDDSRPEIDEYVIDAPQRVIVYFSEDVIGRNSRLDWRITDEPNDTFEFRPTSVEGSGAQRVLNLPFAFGPDEIPFVRYIPENEENTGAGMMYTDGAQNPVAPQGRQGWASDRQRPPLPTIDSIAGQPATGESEAVSNQRRPTLVASGPPNANWVEFWRDDGDGDFEPGRDSRLGEAQVTSGRATFQLPTALAGGLGVEPTKYRFFARSRDEAKCDPNTLDSPECPNFSGPSEAAKYALDVRAPRVFRAGTSGTRVTVGFDEPVLGVNDASHWSVSQGDESFPVTGVSGTGTTRILDAANVPVGANVNYVPPETDFLRDAAGNAVAGFPIEVGEGLDLILHPASISEGAGNPTLRLPISISATPTENVTVAYRTTSVGTATSGSLCTDGVDYRGTSSTVTFQPSEGGTPEEAVIPVCPDQLDEPDEVLQVELHSPNGAFIAGKVALGTILDDDDAPSLSVGDKTTVEGDEGTHGVSFPVSLSAPSGKSVDVAWRLGGDTALVGFDVQGADGTLTLDPGQTSAQVVARVHGDKMYERDERFEVRLSDPRNAVLDDGVGVGTIQNDDAPPVLSIDDAEAVEFDTRTNTATVDLRLDAVSGVPARASFTSRDVTATAGRDYTSASGSVTVPAGALAAQLSWTIRPDSLDEADEWFEVALSDPVDARLGRDVGTVLILDNDGPTDTVRDGGRDRTETSVEVSRDTFPGTTDNVVIARADAYPDALAGGPLAVELVAPILLTPGDGLHRAVRQEVQRLDARTAYLLGGEAALAPAVAAELEGMGLDVVRIGGQNRFETAALIADEVGGSRAYVTEGINVDPNRGWPDAVAVSGLAAHQRAPILLTRAGDLPVETAAAVGDLGLAGVTIVGGPVAVSDGVEAQLRQLVPATERLSGDTRYGTSRAVADRSVEVGMEPRSVWFATGRNWPDSLAAGPAVVHQKHGVLLLIDGQNGFATAPEIGEFLDLHVENILRVVLVGGEAAISDEVADSILLRIGG